MMYPVKPEQVQLGDTVAVTTYNGDLKETVQGQIANIRYLGRKRVWQTGSGQTIGEWCIGSKNNPYIFMIKQYTPKQPDLFDTETSEHVAKRISELIK